MMDLATYLATEGETQSAFADRVETTPAQISRICGGKRYPGRELAKRIVAATGGKVSLADLFGSDSETETPAQDVVRVGGQS